MTDAIPTRSAANGHLRVNAVPKDDNSKTREIRFLANTFDIPPVKAAALVASSDDEAVRIAATATQQLESQDPLAGVPVPEPERDAAHVETHSSELEKPVVHEKAEQN